MQTSELRRKALPHQAKNPHRAAAHEAHRPDRAAPCFRVLGLLEVSGYGPVLLTARRQQVVLAVLLLNANRMVPLHSLVHALWDGTPPTTARTQIQSCVSVLRRSLAAAGLGERITTRGEGYVIEAVPAELDLHVFEDLMACGRAALAAREPGHARAAFRQALALWRGDPLTGIDSGTVNANRVRILQRRVEALEDCFDAELQLGLHREAVGEIADLAAEHPLRERLVGQLMTALHRSGRRAEALDLFRTVRRRFIDELGLEPGPSIRQLHQEILTDEGVEPAAAVRHETPVPQAVRATEDWGPTEEPALPLAPSGRAGRGPSMARRRREVASQAASAAYPAPRPPTDDNAARRRPSAREPGPQSSAALSTGAVPRMLPARVPCFTGLDKLLDALRRQLVDDQSPDAPRVAVISGRAGVGKSATAIEISHLLADEFPDAQFYARMTCDSGQTQNTADVLEQFLRVLGFGTAEIPADLDSRAALYRSAIAGRRTLAVVEDATEEAQIRLLIPCLPSSRLIVTTRARVADLPGSIAFELDVLDEQGGLDLLAAVLGRPRVAAETRAANELVELCGGLQLALATVADRLHARPHWTFARVVGMLRAEATRLDQLGHTGAGVRASIQRGYRDLPPVTRRLYARLALLDPGSHGGWLSAPLLDLDPVSASDALETLVDARLVDVVGGAGAEARYRLHELARVHAHELLLADEPEAEQAAALRRVFGAWLYLADGALLRRGGGWLCQPHTATRWPVAGAVQSELLADPSAWYERERAALLAAVRQAAETNSAPYCRDLALCAAELAEGWHPFEHWQESCEQALEAARRGGDQTVELVMQYVLDEARRRETRHGEAAARGDLPLDAFGRAGDTARQEHVERSLTAVRQSHRGSSNLTGAYRPAPSARTGSRGQAAGTPGASSQRT